MKINLFKKEKTFEQEIEEVFAEIISKHNFILTRKHKEQDDVFLLSNNILVIELREYRGETFCTIKRTIDEEMNTGYKMWHVFNFLYPNDETYATTKENGDWISRYEDLQIYAHMLTHKMAFILKGDYFWEKDFLEKKRLDIEQNRLLSKLGYENPINVKKRNNDPTWQTDLEHYIKDNGIVL